MTLNHGRIQKVKLGGRLVPQERESRRAGAKGEGPERGQSFLSGRGVWGGSCAPRNFPEIIAYSVGYDDVYNKCLSLQKKIKSFIAMQWHVGEVSHHWPIIPSNANRTVNYGSTIHAYTRGSGPVG